MKPKQLHIGRQMSSCPEISTLHRQHNCILECAETTAEEGIHMADVFSKEHELLPEDVQNVPEDLVKSAFPSAKNQMISR